MIIEALLSVVYGIFDVLMVFEIPTLPDSVYTYIDTAFEYIASGVGILANYVPIGYLLTLFGIIIAVDGALLIYKFIIWILKKIPMISVS